jgi:hypothetical protein
VVVWKLVYGAGTEWQKENPFGFCEIDSPAAARRWGLKRKYLLPSVCTHLTKFRALRYNLFKSSEGGLKSFFKTVFSKNRRK